MLRAASLPCARQRVGRRRPVVDTKAAPQPSFRSCFRYRGREVRPFGVAHRDPCRPHAAARSHDEQRDELGHPPRERVAGRARQIALPDDAHAARRNRRARRAVSVRRSPRIRYPIMRAAALHAMRGASFASPAAAMTGFQRPAALARYALDVRSMRYPRTRGMAAAALTSPPRRSR
ncbi:hypothetical protein [Burkholderia mallei]|uniref:hypothetical protein n=1 Tax=Burkholderia mallei TaxID=13373 RepID=UPI0002DE441A|nr:hypothetical protein [Burkholderia mallei]WPJ34537.1 hypothetical protein Zagreb_002867 [Burkholderia mallei]WPJ39233.1 hypothetical protein Mukteswar_001918 [Burkholderia mallei]WPJ44112.1 hypothetical protein Bogor_003847 [Burkholderia mallei]